MAMGRPVWTGQIRLSLVALPVKLFTATQSRARLAFHQIHEPSGKRIRYEKVVPGIGPVERDDIIKGFEYEKGEYVLLTDEDLDDIKIEAKKTLELVQFVDQCEIDPIYFDRPYFVVPDDDLAEDAFRVVRDALRRTRKVGLGQIVMRNRAYVAALKPCGKGMMLETLRFEDELRKSSGYFEGIADTKSDQKMVDLAEELIERDSAPFDASVFEDRYTKALKELIRARTEDRKATISVDEDEADGGGKVIDLMAALKRSLDDDGGKGRSSSSRRSAKAKPAPKGKTSSNDKAAGTTGGSARKGRSRKAA